MARSSQPRITYAPMSVMDSERERNLLSDTINSNVEEQVAMFLHVVGHNQRFKKFANVPKEIDTKPRENKKRKRSFLSKEEHAVFFSMTETVKDVATAIRETKVEVLNPDLYGAVMYTAGFSEEALIVAFSHLADNKVQGDGFVRMSEAHRVLWFRTWLAKNFYQ